MPRYSLSLKSQNADADDADDADNTVEMKRKCPQNKRKWQV
jgi:hypothetical protein